MRTDLTEIVKAAQNSNQRAFEALYNLTKDSSYFVAFSITQNENDALDIMQDSYLKVFNSIQQLKNPDAFESWLNRIVANTAKNYIAKKKPMLFDNIGALSNEAFDEAELNQDYLPEQSADSKETSRLLMKIINRLYEEKRLCILMYYYQEMSVGEIAEALQLPVTTVKYKLLAARADIKKEVEKLEKDGTKLYALFPFALFSAQFKSLAKEFSTIHTAPAYSAVHSGVAVSSVSAAATATATVKAGFFTTLAGKVVIAAASVVLIGGGITAAILANSNSQKPTAQNENPTTISTPSAQSDSNTELLTTEQAIEKMKTVGTDDATFVLDGVVYTLPCPLQAFLDNGWVNARGDEDYFAKQTTGSGNGTTVHLKKADGTSADSKLKMNIKNTTQDGAFLKDCEVRYVDVEFHILEPNQDASELILSGGLVFNHAVDTESILQACSDPVEKTNVVYNTSDLPGVETDYTQLSYPTLKLKVNSTPNDAEKYNYHMCTIFPKEERN
ncbi:MAG: sigma-70 family RNA polymerase sigma factor [Lachnospiraceae bacterium]|nr:sigma-70 family RNA polymerase sigma factor [Lachnospiraceae bacterium]